MKRLRDIYTMIAGALVALAFHSCTDDMSAAPDYTVCGKPTSIGVKLDVPKMQQVSRADLTDNQMNRVENVWVRVYNSYTGEAASKAVIIDAVTEDLHEMHPFELDTESGYNFIVAVANIDNTGFRVDPATGEIGTETSLRDLLGKADTWAEFLAITVKSPDIVSPDTPLAMSGCYLPETDHPNIVWRERNFEPVFIPAVADGIYDMPGAIHLRRLTAHVNFNIKPGADVSIEPQSYRVCNVPLRAYAYERDSGDEAGETTPYPNAGDRATQTTTAEHYANSMLFDSRYFLSNGDGSYKFDFWQFENKQTGTAECKSYDLREKEVKSDTGTNTGLYVYLSGETWTPANMATYVEIQCVVNRRDGNKINVDADGNVLDSGGSEAFRYGNAVFTVHLGYCEEKTNGTATAATARDFNCRRNTEYTYNITVNDITNIVVEASREGENQSGMEGVVNDVTNPNIELDCHYAAFNIQITEEERRQANFGFTVEAWDQNGNLVSFSDESGDLSTEKYANWIELRPTTGEDVLAEYKPRSGTYADDKTIFLWELKNFGKASADGWYTVFVNEYVYETADDGDESGSTAWTEYVNKPDRRFWIRTARNTSADGQSVYVRSKYAVSQKSIQTYYSTSNLTPASGTIAAGTAIGVEHSNENRGLNLRQSVYGPDLNNGRYNVWYSWLGGANGGSTVNKKWSEVVSTTAPQKIPAVNAQGVTIAAHTAYLPRTVNYAGTTLSQNSFDPQPNSSSRDDYIEAINACMNRNRDNNGNGTIDASELRWYVPAAGKYLRLILGRNSLSDPVMDYAGITKLFSSNNGENSSLLMYADNGMIIWAMEGVSTSTWAVDTHGANPPWNVRCIRNLGSDMSTVTEGEKISAAYEHDATTRTVKMTYYNELSIRTEKFDGPLPEHYIWNADPSSNYNMVYKAFEYSVGKYVNNSFRYDWLGAISATVFQNNTPCSALNVNGQTGWRVPNQKELAIMRNLGIFENMPKNNNGGAIPYAASCTLEYYDSAGNGITVTPSTGTRNYMVTRWDGGTRLGSGASAYVRCVRDVDL